MGPIKVSHIFKLFVLLFLANPVIAQRTCGTMELSAMHQLEDPEIIINRQIIEKATQNYIKNSTNRAVAGVITIPVVIHVVYNIAAENISDAQIMSQLQILNEDFRRLNSDADNTWSQAADSEIEFCLATIDPNGNATTGITRTFTNETVFGLNDEVKSPNTGGVNNWPAGDYLTIWVCDITPNYLGYAQFPGDSPETDGVVCDYLYFGNIGTATAPFDMGRTMTHEVGHYLNLIHVWGDGACLFDDLVADTPTAGSENYTESPCTFPGPDSCPALDDPDMFQNYMDYSDDICMNLFTLGQKTRMRAVFDGGAWRESLATSSNCGIPVYTFDGPGKDWNSSTNWQNGQVPANGFDGIVVINTDCIKTGATEITGELTVKYGVTFVQK